MWADAWGDSWGSSWGYTVTSIYGDGAALVKRVKTRREAERLRQQILREDAEVVDVIISVIQMGVFD